MQSSNLQSLKYPVGEFAKPEKPSSARLAEWISVIENFTGRLKDEVNALPDSELNYKHRPGGWTIKQLVHHVTDSHMNSFIRFKLALTEDKPVIKPYFEDKWAELPDTVNAPMSYSLQLIEGLHNRWVVLLKSLTEEQLNRTFIHPEYEREFPLWEYVGLYEWHCRHHLAHIRQAMKMKF
jgi:uncharacterized damage-inducible protein DinB